ncbi:MAG TPA: PAC2 family protein [Chitinispirillaceae bacterium]|nr:PAC2 family protein [Chitinispirillaceae bacterium]
MNIVHRTHFNSAPLLFAAWTGAGNVGILAMDYLRRKLNSHLFAQIDMSQFITPDSIVVNSGVTYFPDTPQSVFYHNHNPDLVIFESNAHAGGVYDVEVMRAILELSRELNTPRIYTAAALPQSISHIDQPRVLYACNNPKLKGELESRGLEPMPDGIISGLNGLMLGFAGVRGIDAVCLLATIPAYAGTLTYPRASLSIVAKLSEITGVEIDLSELEHDIEIADPMFAQIEDKIKEFFSSGVFEEEPEIPGVQQEDVPKYVMDRIERMFKNAAHDHAKAQDLKKELDKWGLYKLYEDRFLDLFE